MRNWWPVRRAWASQLVPQFRQKKRDAAARAIIGDCFKGREIVPIDCYQLIWGLGTLHCMTQQEPA